MNQPFSSSTILGDIKIKVRLSKYVIKKRDVIKKRNGIKMSKEIVSKMSEVMV